MIDLDEMETPASKEHSPAVRLTAHIVAAYVSKNPLQVSELPAVIESVHKALAAAVAPPMEVIAAEKLVPAVPVKKSITPDYIVCLEDGKQLKMLKRHLATTYHLTPDEYRTKWGLPPDYPMVAPTYAAQRSTLAKQAGLGRKPEAGTATPAKRDGRPKKSA